MIKVMTNTSDRSMQIVEEIDFILGHFSNPIFPRKIMTAITKGQIEVFDKQTILIHFERAGYKDCRINAYSSGYKKIKPIGM